MEEASIFIALIILSLYVYVLFDGQIDVLKVLK